MASRLYNLAWMTTATTGTGTITLGSAVAPWLTFAQAGVPDGATVSYTIFDGVANSETGTGTYTSSGTTLTRNPLKSTNSNSAINLSGNAQVFVTARAEDIPVPQNYLSGMTLSTAGSSSTFTVAAGNTADSTNSSIMTLASAISKTTSSWAVGSGNGGVASGEAIQTSSWYHAYSIRRPDTDVTDVLVSQAPSVSATITVTIASPAVVTWTGSGLEAGAPVVFTTTNTLPTGITAGTTYYVKTMVTVDTFQIAATQGGAAINTSGSQSGVHTGTSNPTLPTSYTEKRRIGSMKTDGSSLWTAFVQSGDLFEWVGGAITDVNVVNPGTSAVMRTLTVPKGVAVVAIVQVGFSTNVVSSNPAGIILTDPAINDTAPSVGNAMVLNYLPAGTAANFFTFGFCRTNTSAQIRSRMQISDANISLNINTTSWQDRRGKDG